MQISATVGLGFVGLILGLIGSVALAVSLNRVIAALSLASDAHDLAIEGLVTPGGSIVRFTGTYIHVEAGRKSAARWVTLGLWLLVLSFACQAAALVVPLVASR